MKHPSMIGVPAIALLAVVGSSAPAFAPETVELTPVKVELREGKGPAYKVVATARHGEKVTKGDADDKGWVLIERGAAEGGQKGYAHAKALAASGTPASGKDDLWKGRSDKAEISAAAAAKGIEPQTEMYARGKSHDTSGLVELRRRRESIAIEDYEAFLKALRGSP